MKIKRYFITGTDTDCGKTYVTVKLVDVFKNAAAIKPVASGCVQENGQLISLDAQRLQQNTPLPLEVINPWRFPLPVSPHIASRKEGVHLSVSELASYCMDFSVPGLDSLFIEGAGGLMVPLNEEETWVDFLKSTGIPVIIVVGLKLGCINHALLTETALRAHGISCLGWVANCLDPRMLALAENIESLQKRMQSPCLATVPYLGDLTLASLHL